MAFVHGKNAYIQLDNSAGTLVDLSSITNEISFSIAIDTAETSVFGTNAKQYITGQNDATISLTGLFDATSATVIEGTIDALIAGTIASATLVFGPEGSAAGKKKYTQETIVTSYEIGAPVGDVVSLSVEFQRTGATTIATFS
jgi:hypothetical protein